MKLPQKVHHQFYLREHVLFHHVLPNILHDETSKQLFHDGFLKRTCIRQMSGSLQGRSQSLNLLRRNVHCES